ncbi:unnamed protein product, partial [Oppiella nova]
KGQSFFDTNEIIRFELDFQSVEYTLRELPVSGRLSIHDNTEIGNSLSNSYVLEPGYYYQFYINRKSTKMLRTPYATDCVDYMAIGETLVNQTQDFASIALSRKARMKCAVECRPSCWTDNYELSVQKLPLEYYGRADWSSTDPDLMSNPAVVSIRYWSTEHTINNYSPMFAILDMVCYVGGLISMYTGMSLIAGTVVQRRSILLAGGGLLAGGLIGGALANGALHAGAAAVHEVSADNHEGVDGSTHCSTGATGVAGIGSAIGNGIGSGISAGVSKLTGGVTGVLDGKESLIDHAVDFVAGGGVSGAIGTAVGTGVGAGLKETMGVVKGALGGEDTMLGKATGAVTGAIGNGAAVHMELEKIYLEK